MFEEKVANHDTVLRCFLENLLEHLPHVLFGHREAPSLCIGAVAHQQENALLAQCSKPL